MGFYDDFTNKYKVSKTIRMALIPEGKTTENVIKIIQEDKIRNEKFKEAKKMIDKAHRVYIEEKLSNASLSIENLEKWLEEYKNNGKKEKSVEATLRKEIASYLKKGEIPYQLIDCESYLGEEYKNEIDDLLKVFKDFKTYFNDFEKNRKNVYSSKNIATSIPHRIVNDNLPKFAFNNKILEKIVEKLGEEFINDTFRENNYNVTINEIMQIDYYNKVLTQSGIDFYNSLIGVINTKINLYNQVQKDKKDRFVQLNILFKQILSETEKKYVVEKYTTDEELLNELNEYLDDSYKTINSEVPTLLNNIDFYDLEKIFIKNDDQLTTISKKLYGDWAYIENSIYNTKVIGKKKVTEDEVRRGIRNKKYYSIGYINSLLNEEDTRVENYFIDELKKSLEIFNENLETYKNYVFDKELIKDEIAIEIIKKLCDSIKGIEWVLKPLIVENFDIDTNFYGEMEYYWSSLQVFDGIYNKIRNYLTRKPYSIEKFRLNFDCSSFLEGWSYTKEKDYLGSILKDENFYYLAIKNKNKNYKGNFIADVKLPENKEDTFYKMNYYKAYESKKVIHLLVDINGKTELKRKNFEKDGKPYLPDCIIKIRDTKSYDVKSKNYSKEDMIKYIDYYKERVIEYYKNMKFQFKESCEYKSYNEFEEDYNSQIYSVTFEPKSKKEIYNLVDEGKIFLFKIYCKDFSEHSKGTPNLHTLYWKMLFDEDNLNNIVYKLSGKAKMFFREKSLKIEETTVHKVNEILENKKPRNEKRTSKFKYELIIKNRRYTVDKFLFHCHIEMNFKEKEIKNKEEEIKKFNNDFNKDIKRAIKYNDDIYAVGIDRGERNLLYACVVNSKGKLIEQVPLNIVSNVDYHSLLVDREKKRKEGRKNWKIIENIKDLKEGYLSQAINEINKLLLKYNAILVLEDLNFGFKRTRTGKFERSVYQKFEKMLIDKLNYWVIKNRDKNENGGLLKAYQLTNKFISFKDIGKQSGIIFYIPAWNTSKIDPVTGFVNLFYIKYENVKKAKEFFDKFKSIKFNKECNYFEFEFDYNDFNNRAGKKTAWTICSYGDRIKKFRNPENNNKWDDKFIESLTGEFKKIFEKFNIDIYGNIKEQILNIDNKEFFVGLIDLFKLMLQMRNSSDKMNLDYIISPVQNKNGEFFDSRKAGDDLPKNADANGAYNIARKGLMCIDRIQNTSDDKLNEINLFISKDDWMNYAQGEEF